MPLLRSRLALAVCCWLLVVLVVCAPPTPTSAQGTNTTRLRDRAHTITIGFLQYLNPQAYADPTFRNLSSYELVRTRQRARAR